MPLISEIERHAGSFIGIRHDLHAHPELGFEEHRTAAIVASRLREWGIECHEGIGGTGLVGVIDSGRPGPSIGLRADMDALPMEEQTGLPYRSVTKGRFHGCGHDGHTTTLLATAHHLAAERNFSGRVVLIFQPAEEGLGGALRMLDEGLLERFPCDAIYGFHNWPELPAGEVRVLTGPTMAGAAFFDVALVGSGSHAAMPHMARDTIAGLGQLISTLQNVVSRTIDPLSSAVLSITRVEGGSAYNVLPERAALGGTLRYLTNEVRDRMMRELRRIAAGCAESFDLIAEVDIREAFPVTVNAAHHAAEVAKAARLVLGTEAVHVDGVPSMGSEDFAIILERVPGAYFFIGSCFDIPLHHPKYQFDDNVITSAASILVTLVSSTGAKSA